MTLKSSLLTRKFNFASTSKFRKQKFKANKSIRMIRYLKLKWLWSITSQLLKGTHGLPFQLFHSQRLKTLTKLSGSDFIWIFNRPVYVDPSLNEGCKSKVPKMSLKFRWLLTCFIATSASLRFRKLNSEDVISVQIFA